LLDSKGEAAETQVWLGFARSFGYLNEKTIQILDEKNEHIHAQILRMIQCPEKWSI
jgi:four helix bundle protein